MNKSFDKLKMNFVKIELSYKKFGSLFFLKSQLHEQFKDGCTELIQLFQPITFELNTVISMIKSKKVLQVMESSLVF